MLNLVVVICTVFLKANTCTTNVLVSQNTCICMSKFRWCVVHLLILYRLRCDNVDIDDDDDDDDEDDVEGFNLVGCLFVSNNFA